jgi:hypothetical protein
VAHEVGAVVKASITAAAQAVFVFVTFDVALFFCEFEAGLVLYGKHRGGGGGGGSVSGSSPVVRSSGSGSGHFVRSLFVVESATIRQYIGKVFQFYSNDSRKKRIMKKVAGAIPPYI